VACVIDQGSPLAISTFKPDDVQVRIYRADESTATLVRKDRDDLRDSTQATNQSHAEKRLVQWLVTTPSYSIEAYEGSPSCGVGLSAEPIHPSHSSRFKNSSLQSGEVLQGDQAIPWRSES